MADRVFVLSYLNLQVTWQTRKMRPVLWGMANSFNSGLEAKARAGETWDYNKEGVLY